MNAMEHAKTQPVQLIWTVPYFGKMCVGMCNWILHRSHHDRPFTHLLSLSSRYILVSLSGAASSPPPIAPLYSLAFQIRHLFFLLLFRFPITKLARKNAFCVFVCALCLGIDNIKHHWQCRCTYSIAFIANRKILNRKKPEKMHGK